jgi:hypothetical protein
VYGLIFPAIFAIAFAVQWMRSDTDRDSYAYWIGARYATEPTMFTAEPLGGPVLFDPGPHPPLMTYLYPPPLAAALKPLGQLSWPAFARIWLLVCAAAFWAFAAICVRAWTGPMRPRAVSATAGILFLTPPVMLAWGLQQADILVWVLIGAGTVWASGSALSGAAYLKVIGAYPLAFLLLRSRQAWYGLAWMTAAVALICLVSLGPRGTIDEWTIWLTRILPSLGQGEFWDAPVSFDAFGESLGWNLPGNLAPAVLPIRALGYGATDAVPALGRVYLLVLGIGAPLVAGILTRRRPASHQITAVIAATLLAAPILRLTYLPMLVPGVLILWRNHGNGDVSRMRRGSIDQREGVSSLR